MQTPATPLNPDGSLDIEIVIEPGCEDKGKSGANGTDHESAHAGAGIEYRTETLNSLPAYDPNAVADGVQHQLQAASGQKDDDDGFNVDSVFDAAVRHATTPDVPAVSADVPPAPAPATDAPEFALGTLETLRLANLENIAEIPPILRNAESMRNFPMAVALFYKAFTTRADFVARHTVEVRRGGESRFKQPFSFQFQFLQYIIPKIKALAKPDNIENLPSQIANIEDPGEKRTSCSFEIALLAKIVQGLLRDFPEEEFASPANGAHSRYEVGSPSGRLEGNLPRENKAQRIYQFLEDCYKYAREQYSILDPNVS